MATKGVLYNGVPLLNSDGNPVVYDADANPEGPPDDCCCPVECCAQPEELTATLSGTGGCSTLSATITLTETSPNIWQGTGTCGTFTLVCTAEGATDCPSSWRLSVGGCPSTNNLNRVPDSGTCDCENLYLEFTFTVTAFDLACPAPCCAGVPGTAGTYKVVITI